MKEYASFRSRCGRPKFEMVALFCLKLSWMYSGSPYGVGMDAVITVGSWNTNVIMVWAWMLCSPYDLGTRTELRFGHGCSGHRMLLEHERNYALSGHALVTVCS